MRNFGKYLFFVLALMLFSTYSYSNNKDIFSHKTWQPQKPDVFFVKYKGTSKYHN